MIHTRRLTAERSTIVESGSTEAVEELLSSQVLAEWQSPTASVPSRYIIAFAHHVMFDFAVSQLFLPIQSERVVGKLAADPDLIMIIRPSIVMRYEQLWREDRPEFWNLLFQISAEPHIPQIGKLIGSSVLAGAPCTLIDLEPMMQTSNQKMVIFALRRRSRFATWLVH